MSGALQFGTPVSSLKRNVWCLPLSAVQLGNQEFVDWASKSRLLHVCLLSGTIYGLVIDASVCTWKAYQAHIKY